jgi:drug/metabolite transporter (DMT)-like permease
VSLVIGQVLPSARTELLSPTGRLPLLLAFAVLYLVWGSTYLAIRFAVETLPPFLLMGTRSLVAGALLYGWARRRGGPALSRREWSEAFLQGGLLFVGCHGALAWAQERVPSGQAALLFATMPAWMALGEWLGPERLRPGLLVVPGLLLGMAGVAVLTHPAELLGSGATEPSGAIALLFASLSWVIGSLRARHAPLPGGALQAAGANLLAGGLMLAAVAWLRGERAVSGEVSARSLLALLYLIGFGTMLALTTYLWLLRRARPTLVSTYAFVNPLVAVLLGTLLGGEHLDARIQVATVLLIASVAILLGDQARRRAST